MSDKQIKELWSKLMEYQTDLALPLELIFYYQSEAWLASNSVIDLGTGNGYYLNKILKYFPSKHYKGVDIEPFYVKLAKNRFAAKKYHNSNIRIELQNLFQVTEKFDLVLARLLVQHLSSCDKFLEHVYEILNPGGTLLIIDSNDSVRYFYPEIPHMESFFDALRKKQKASDGDRDAALSITTKADNYGFQINREMKLIVPSTIVEHKNLFFQSYKTVFEIVKQDYQVEFDYSILKKELAKWFSLETSYTQLGVYVVSYRKV